MTGDESVSDPYELIEALVAETERLSRRLERQRKIRHKAEEIAERGLTDLYQRQRELEFLSTITTLANEAVSADDMLASVLQYICHFTGWPAAHAYVIRGEGAEQHMEPSNIWHVDSGLDLSELQTATAQRCFDKGEGLPGQVWESGKSVWLDDLADSDNFPRRDSALRSGVCVAFSAPLLVGSEVTASIEFFGLSPMPEDAALLDVIARAGTQLGRVMERDRAHMRVQEVMRKLSEALENSSQAHALLRTKTDAMMDPQASFEAVRNSDGLIVDLAFSEANHVACLDFGINREQLVGRRFLTTATNAARAGLMDKIARCIEQGEPIILDEFPYGNDALGDLRYYDIRAVRIGADSINATWRNVTERVALARDVALALEDSKRAHALVRANTDALLDPQVLFEGVRDSSGHIVDLLYRDVNSVTCQYLGLGRDDLIGHSCLETLPNIDGSGLLSHYIRCAETGEPVILDEFPYYNELLDDLRYYDVRGAYAERDSISLTWRDVTERVVAAQKISESEQRFRLLAENMGDVVVHVRDGRVAWISPSVEEVLGAPPDYWVGRDLGDIVPPEDQSVHLTRLRRIDEDGFLVVPARVLAVDGTVHWIHTHARTYFDTNGNPDGFTASFRVIDDEVRAMEDAEESRRRQAEADARYRRLMANSPIGMCLVTPEGRFEAVNLALCHFFGYDADTLQQKTWQELTAAEYLEADLGNVDDVLAGRIDSYRMLKQFVHADGSLIWGDLSVSCLRNPMGMVENFLSQITDITAEVEAREQVNQRDRQNRVLTQRIQAQSNRLMSELRSAAAYVTSVLPDELNGPVRVSSRYLPSRELGGDTYDYTWIDDDHLVMHLIDVSGHGIEPSLLSISVHNLLRSGSLPIATLLEPDQVLAVLNEKFPMDQHGGNYFTLWYGVHHYPSRTLRYASAGHPPALAFTTGRSTPTELSTACYPIGLFDDTEFSTGIFTVPRGTQLLLYSDGAIEIPLPRDQHWSLAGFVDMCTTLRALPEWSLDTLIDGLRSLTVGGLFADDCSLVLLNFD
jgi:sigma-B regulation protein RsbU (phosphoserine phosphatase)